MTVYSSMENGKLTNDPFVPVISGRFHSTNGMNYPRSHHNSSSGSTLLLFPFFSSNSRGEMMIRVDPVQKVISGGTMLRYRALVVGGNTKGCAGFGIGKGASPSDAEFRALRMCKRNIFFMETYNGTLTRDLVGRHNSCTVVIKALPAGRGVFGHPLVCEILGYFGVADFTVKAHGNRNHYNVVLAAFKAIATHQSLREISRGRGLRMMSLERARRLGV